MPSIRSRRLLVSVRNAAEANAALAGGCDVLDVKEPARGSLGMADPATIAAVVLEAGEAKSPAPVSAALGEAVEWERDRDVPRLPDAIAYLKLGTAGLGNDAAWARRFAEVKHRLARDERESASDGEFDSVKWIAVGYADWEIAWAPRPEEVIVGAGVCGCAGVLIDTHSKTNGRLFDLLTVARLQLLAALARQHGLEFALAGRLQAVDLPRVCLVDPDIVGIRSAACSAGIRTGEIDAAAVRRFRSALQDASQSVAPAIRPVHPSGVGVAQCG